MLKSKNLAEALQKMQKKANLAFTPLKWLVNKQGNLDPSKQTE